MIFDVLYYANGVFFIGLKVEIYQKEIEDMKNMTRQEHVAHLRRKSSGFSRGASIYRGVTRSFYVHVYSFVVYSFHFIKKCEY